MRLVTLAILLVACGGGNASDTADTDTDGTTPADLCEGIPTYDLSDLDCDQLANAAEDTVDAADRCNTKADCQVLRAECEHWVQMGCWYPANTCVSAGDWGAFNSEAGSCAVGGMVCECGEPPEVDCVSGKCQFVY